MVYSVIGNFIAIRNKNKEIINYLFVDEDKYNELILIKWSMRNNYIGNSKYGLIHRYLTKPSKDLVVDHINNNPSDNRLINLRVVTQQENIMNTYGNNNLSSKFKGVHYHKLLKKFRARCGKNIIGNFEKEEHAAYAYDKYVKEKFKCAVSNNIEKPIDFIDFIPKTRKEKNIYLTQSGRWRVIINRKTYGCFKTKEEAIVIREKILKENEINRISKKNINGIPIRNIYKNNITHVVLLDEDIYIKLHNISLHINKDGYPLLSNNKLLSIYIMNPEKEKVVDHINSNKLDNRRCNLRIVNTKQNSMNKTKSKNTTSKYIGVYYNKLRKKWNANIIYLGSFEKEEEAAKIRDSATNKYFGIYGKLNLNA